MKNEPDPDSRKPLLTRGRLVVVFCLAGLVLLGYGVRDPAWSLCKYWFVWTEANMARDQASATLIIEALDRFRAQRGSYPESLQELTPEFIDQLGAPIIGDLPWRYSRSGDAASFELGFGNTMDSPVCWYSSVESDWDCDTR